jgi:hypothetical protein
LVSEETTIVIETALANIQATIAAAGPVATATAFLASLALAAFLGTVLYRHS